MTWTIEHARELYNIPQWSNGYFEINDQGHLCAHPKHNHQNIDLFELAQHIEKQWALPVLVRFNEVLHHRVDSLCSAFQMALQTEHYPAHYTAVYPIKVNQQRHVVQEILKNRNTGEVGLEAGSKPELLAVLALSKPDGLIICNGYKDRKFIRLALIGQACGLRVHLVVEKAAELKLIIEESANLGIRPRLGVRVRLVSIGAGKWQNTGGEKAKFGLSSSQVLEVIKQLKNAQMLDCLHLMHFHIGSQVGNIRDIQRAIGEAARYYVQLQQLGAPIVYADVGGGLGIDYDGTQSRNECSINYSVQEYASAIVRGFSTVCKQYNAPFPHLISESGRAITAHHAVLITHVTDVEYAEGENPPVPAQPEEHQIIQRLWEDFDNLEKKSVVEIYHDAIYELGEAQDLFAHGMFNLAQRARAEQLYFAICRKVRNLLSISSPRHREILEELNEKLADKYFCNFSLFQSIPDAWGIDQLFPIVPLHRLNEKPNRRATIQDLTCDSDGQVHRYVDAEGVETSLPVHEIEKNEPYLLGIFLVGAYQEILGDMHNLFGDTHAINVQLTETGYELIEPELGDTVEDMLKYVHFDMTHFREHYRLKLANAGLSNELQQRYFSELEEGLQGYTYLE
jgi:arginine decarboxylase